MFVTVRPHMSEAEYHETEQLVQDFEQREGRVLHEKLCDYAKYKRNWVWY